MSPVTLRWDDPNPVYIDFESQSACDLREVGGRLYAAHETTRVLSLVVDCGDGFLVWLPTLPEVDTPKVMGEARLWEYGVNSDVVLLFAGPAVPEPVRRLAASGRTFVAHNALGFDVWVWQRFVDVQPAAWADTLYLARAAGMPGGLDRLARAEWAKGKDAAEKIVKKLWAAKYKTRIDGNGVKHEDLVYPDLQPGQVALLLRYNLVDVLLMRRLWESLDSLGVEADVIAAHAAVNCRGVAVDVSLADRVRDVSDESAARAGARIRELTGGELENHRSTAQVHAWLAKQGVRVTNADGKKSLRKDVVEQALLNPELMLDSDAPVAAVADIPPEVFEVLRLRSAAVRITGAKAERARARVSPDGRMRDVFGYHQAHTGRWSSTGVQVHNLPRPKKGVPVDELLRLHDAGELPAGAGECYGLVESLLPKGRTVDDALGALVRPCLVAAPGKVLLVGDYAQVECRGVAWVADEQSLLDTFAAGGDVYKLTASTIYGVPVEEIDDPKRQVGKVVVLGCGYGLGVEKFRLYAAAMGIDLQKAGVTAEACIDAYRKAYPRIAGEYAGQIAGRPYRRGGLWSKLEAAALAAVRDGGSHAAGKCTFTFDGSTLRVYLPSGRALHYRDARVEDVVPGYVWALGLEPKAKATLVYSHPRGYPASMYGGKWAENVVQALCRDFLATALVRLEGEGLPVVLHVHDELVCEVDADAAEAGLRRMAEIISSPPAWADGFPLAVELFACRRYVKGATPGSLVAEAAGGHVHKFGRKALTGGG